MINDRHLIRYLILFMAISMLLMAMPASSYAASDVNAGYLETSGIETVVRVDKTDPAHPVVIIRNTTGVELPMTGGPGTTALYMIGALLLAVSAVGLIARRRARS